VALLGNLDSFKFEREMPVFEGAVEAATHHPDENDVRRPMMHRETDYRTRRFSGPRRYRRPPADCFSSKQKIGKT
jgi:hypothetical protein